MINKYKITGKESYLLDGYIFAVIFETISHWFCGLSLPVRLRKRDLAVFFCFYTMKVSSHVGCPPWGPKSGVKHVGHQGISFVFFD